jgi:putative colanic acid biosynthesis acetyltransferase WcaF
MSKNSISKSNRFLMNLDQYSIENYSPGASIVTQSLWFFLGDPLVRARFIPFSCIKTYVLRLFGSTLGKGVRIKPGVKIKYPWRLRVGNHCWIGENAWLDNVAFITLEDHVCLSQDVYLCTGNHNWQDQFFGLTPRSIYIEEGSWIAARAIVGPGVTVGKGAVLCIGAVASKHLDPMTIYAGNPAIPIKTRVITSIMA